MNGVREIDIKSFTYYFLDDMINVKKFNPKKIKIDKESYKNIIYYIDYVATNGVKLLYLNYQ